jgi:hypothetical protein
MDEAATAATGGCQCGAVRYRAALRPDTAHICHCRMCQKAVGNAFAALVGVKGGSLAWTRGQPATFRSSDPVDRGFCADCGTPLFYRAREGDHHALCIGTLDDPAAVPPVRQCGMEGRQTWLDHVATLPDTGTTEADMAAQVPAIRASNRQHPDHETARWPAP